MAPTMRWRIPPESWWGYSRTRWPGAAMRTASRRPRALVQALRRLSCSCTRMGSATWSPMVNSGFSEAMGSWRIMAIRLPRMCRISTSDLGTRSSPSKRMAPPTMRAAVGSRRSSERARVVLPEPDSPTIPSVSPASREKETSCTARVTRVPRAVM